MIQEIKDHYINVKLLSATNKLAKEFSLPFSLRRFSSGEYSIKVLRPPLDYCHSPSVIIEVKNLNEEQLTILEYLNDAIENLFEFNLSDKLLKIGYLGHGRQDRIVNSGESFSLRVFCNRINAMTFDSVTIINPHSDVSSALIRNSLPINLLSIFKNTPYLNDLALSPDLVFVSPDAGANKQIAYMNEYYGRYDYVKCQKFRDPKTLKVSIQGMNYAEPDLTGKTCLIVDDICDYGNTFKPIAKELKNKYNAKEVILYVTHGFFFGGVNELAASGIDRFITTDTVFRYHDKITTSDKIEVLTVQF